MTTGPAAQSPKVSVSIITYNHAPFIRQALEGVLAQRTDFPFEIVIGDDCSTDGTRKIVKEYALAHPDLIVPLLPERNLGDSGRKMFMETMKHSRGEFIAILEGDDYWIFDGKLQRQVEFLESHPECSLCFHDAIVIAEGEDKPRGNFMPPRHPPFISTPHLIRWFCIPACSPMMRKEVIGELPKWYFEGPWGDLPFYLAAAELGSLGYIDEAMGVYRIHSGGVWSRLDEISKLRSEIEVLEALEEPLGPEYAQMLSETMSWRHASLAGTLARAKQWREALHHFAIALRHDPTLKISLRLAVRDLTRKTIGSARRLVPRRSRSGGDSGRKSPRA